MDGRGGGALVTQCHRNVVFPATFGGDFTKQINAAIGSYAVAVFVAFVLLSPVLPSRVSGAVGVVPTGPQPVLYTVRPGDTPSGIAASQGISLSQLFALNPDLTPLKDPGGGASVVVGLR